MGNCQAIDAASLVIKHPDGRIERLYSPVTASEVMRMNEGHHVTLIIPLPTVHSDDKENVGLTATVRVTRVKLLRPTDTLSLGHVYRLVTTEEVMKVLRAKKYEKMRIQQQTEDDEQKKKDKCQISSSNQARRDSQKTTEMKMAAIVKQGRRHESSGTRSKPVKPRSWRPSLNSISEGGVELHSK